MGKIFINDNQLQERVDASEKIEERFGLEKALGYLIGENYYNLSLSFTMPLNKLGKLMEEDNYECKRT